MRHGVPGVARVKKFLSAQILEGKRAASFTVPKWLENPGDNVWWGHSGGIHPAMPGSKVHPLWWPLGVGGFL